MRFGGMSHVNSRCSQEHAMPQTHSHSHPPPRYDRSCSTNASIVGVRAAYHALRHLQKQCSSTILGVNGQSLLEINIYSKTQNKSSMTTTLFSCCIPDSDAFYTIICATKYNTHSTEK